ncbi:MAG: anaerobic ribonucleoside-triphosphate reductase [archaeon]
MSKYDMLADVAKKVSVLDNDLKLKILALLTEGSKSITDVARELNMNFSTTHKYLEQLENADLVTSKQISENRLKRIFTISNFEIVISPESLMNLKVQETEKAGKNVKILDARSKSADFNSKDFIDRYIRAGIPMNLIKDGVNYIRERMYDEVSLIELESEFFDFLREKKEKIDAAMASFGTKGLFGEGTFSNALRSRKEFDIIKSMVDGDLHIESIGRAHLLNFSHDLHTTAVLGFDAPPKNLKEFLNQVLITIKSCEDIVFSKHCLDSFNYFAAQFIKNKSVKEVTEIVDGFIKELETLGVKTYIGLDIGVPRFFTYIRAIPQNAFLNEEKEIRDIHSTEITSQTVPYSDYKNEANMLANIVLDIINKNKFMYIFPVLKFWEDWKSYDKIELRQNYFLANMNPKWQGVNATYANSVRFDSRWKYWYRCVRVGECQSVCINMPRLALKNKSEEEFFLALKGQLDNCYKILLLSAEAIMENLHKKKADVIKKRPKRGQYVHLDDSMYSISVCGLDETVKILSNKPITENIKLAKSIINFCEKFAKEKSELLIRINIKENSNPFIAKRFYHLDSKKFDVPVKSYATGITDKEDIEIFELHENLSGGHCGRIPKSDAVNLKNLLGKSWGLIKLV